MRTVLALVTVSLVVGCGGSVTMGVADPTASTFDGLPCDVAAVLQNRCTSCHGATLAGSAPYSLASRADLIELAPAPYATQTKAQRALARMAATTAPMPPTPASAATAAEQASLAAWVDGGMPAGSCGAPQIVCTSGVTSSAREGTSMRPGGACQSCHQGNGEARGYQFMGTVYATFHEQNNCEGKPAAGVVVDILSGDGSGKVLLTIAVSSPSGNFYQGSGVATPYRARVRDASGKTREMLTPQTSGDCNACHTELGTNGAPGRIAWPN
jgi:hypothetical protein